MTLKSSARVADTNGGHGIAQLGSRQQHAQEVGQECPANPAQIEQLTSVVAQQQQIQHLAQQRQ